MSTGISPTTLIASAKMARPSVLHASLGQTPANLKTAGTLLKASGKTPEPRASRERQTASAFGRPDDMRQPETTWTSSRPTSTVEDHSMETTSEACKKRFHSWYFFSKINLTLFKFFLVEVWFAKHVSNKINTILYHTILLDWRCAQGVNSDNVCY